MDDKLLELIIDYKMDKVEAKAWKVAIMYLELARKYFPNYKHYTVGKGDPRKGTLFRHCYKLVREYDQYIEDNEYRLYMTAQMQIMKNIDYGDSGQAFINPNCIVGTKAWKRWLLWKNKFYENVKTEVQPSNVHSREKVLTLLKETKKFLEAKLGKLTKKSIVDSLDNKNIFRWCALGDVSGYYLALSPIVNSWVKAQQIDLLESFTVDVNYYKNGVDKDIENAFVREFAYEF